MSRRAGPARLAAVTAGLLVSLAGAAAATASFLASRVVRIRRHPRYRHRLIAVDGDKAVLARDRETERPGTYGLAAPGVHAVIGEVESSTDRTVVRSVVSVQHGSLAPGRVALDHVHIGDPRTAVGLDFEAFDLAGEAGPLPTWCLRGGDTWVIVAHGLGGSRASSLSFLPILEEAGHTILAVSYQNDPGAAPSADRRYHLGEEEWRDLDVAMAYALSQGAAGLVLFGWSLGGAIVLQALVRSPRAGAVAAVVLDSPVLDWRRVLHHTGRRWHLPRPLVALSLVSLEHRIGIDLDDFDWLARSGELRLPILDFHSETDAVVPFEVSAELARRRPDLVDLVAVPGAGHVGSWNVDPSGYARRITAFIERCLELSPGSFE